jgi:hypothetical protein
MALPGPRVPPTCTGVSYARRMSKHRRLPDVDALRLLAALHGAVCAGTVAYWAGFMAGSVRTEESASYLDFERSFQLADTYLATASAAAALACWRRDQRALPLGLMASSASIYLGCMDVLYNVRHAKYRQVTPAMAVEIAINAYSLVVSPLAAWTLWRQRDKLHNSATARLARG